jgi:hypothetical protein
MKMSKILLVNPGILNLLLCRIFQRGEIYVYGLNSTFIKRFIPRLSKIRALKIFIFEYEVGTADLGYNAINSIFMETAALTEEYLEKCGDQPLLQLFNKVFKTNAFPIVWKRKVSWDAWELYCNLLGLIRNYSSPFIIYLKRGSIDSLLAKRLFAKYPSFKSQQKHFLLTPGIIENIVLHLLWLTKQIFSSGFQIQKKEKKKYRIALEAASPIKTDVPFSLLEWWDGKTIAKKDVLFFSLGSKEPGRVEGIRNAKEMGFQWASARNFGRISLNELKSIILNCLVLPFRYLFTILKSSEAGFFFSAIREYYFWNRFFSAIKIDYYILSSSLAENFCTIFMNYFQAKTIGITHGYIGALEYSRYKYMHMNHFITWGKAQTYYFDSEGIEKTHYVGCYPLTYFQQNVFYSNQCNAVISNKKKNIVFFDNKILKNFFSEEQYINFYELIIDVSERFDVNVFLRCKTENPFLEKYYKEKKKATDLKNRFEEKNIVLLSRAKFDNIMQVFSFTDIVIYNIVGSPSMLANLLGIPCFSFYDRIEETADPIMKNYLNTLVIDDREKLFTQIEQVLENKECVQLTHEHKQLLNHHSDNKGLERFQKLVNEIVLNKL